MKTIVKQKKKKKNRKFQKTVSNILIANKIINAEQQRSGLECWIRIGDSQFAVVVKEGVDNNIRPENKPSLAPP